MKAVLPALIALAVSIPAFGQYSARTLTRRIAPQTARPPAAAPRYNPSSPAPAVAPRAAAPADQSKAAAEKAKNDEKQFQYFKKRAEEGSDHAQYELGVRYLAGRGVAADEKLARQWLAKAAKQGNTRAARKLAELGSAAPASAAAHETATPLRVQPKAPAAAPEPAKTAAASR